MPLTPSTPSPTHAAILSAALALAAPLGLALPACADDTPEPMRRIAFQVERTSQVDNDRVTAIMRVTHDDVDPARLAGRVNADMSWALERARAVEQVEVRSGQYRTNPVRERQRITGWTASQELILSSGAVERVTALVGALQEKLQLASLEFSVSDATRREVEDGLIAQVIAGYQARASLIRDALGARSHELARLDIHTSSPPPMPVRMHAARLASAESAPPPAVEGGTSTVTVTASATIELR